MRLKRIFVAIIAVLLVIIVSGCKPSGGSGDQADNKANATAYSRGTAQVPAEQMNYFQSRLNINRWTETWGQKDKISYNYIQVVVTDPTTMTAKLVPIGYYALKGLPMSYCTGLTPPTHIEGDTDGGYINIPNPGVDAVFYSGGDCERYYGFDATTGQYVEYKLAFDESLRTTDQPLDNVQVPDLGPSGK